MLIVMKTTARGPDFSADPGQTVEVADARGQELVDAGAAYMAETLCDAPAAAEAEVAAPDAPTIETPAPPAARRERAARRSAPG